MLKKLLRNPPVLLINLPKTDTTSGAIINLSNIDRVRQEASINIKNSQDRQRDAYNSKRVPAVTYAVGDLVKITKTNFANDGKSKKLLPKFIGPYIKIIKCLGNDRYKIANIPGINKIK